jgi:hypothetical protein
MAVANEPAPRIGVLERNRTAALRMARVFRSASQLASVACEEDPVALRAALGPDPRLLACEVADLDLALEWCDTRYPNMRVIAWTSDETSLTLERARHPALQSIVGWPAHQSTPRTWELLYAVRRVLEPEEPPPSLTQVFGWASSVVKYRPSTSSERDAVVAEVTSLAEQTGAPLRIAQRVGEVAHELIMNAMYDAPVNQYGEPKYAQDRKQHVALEPEEVPTLRFGFDGVSIGLQVTDPFGRLTREHVIEGIMRATRAADSSPDVGSILNTANGGAGLGIFRMYANSAALFFETVPSVMTSVSAYFDIDVNPRASRSLPVSLHLFLR